MARLPVRANRRPGQQRARASGHTADAGNAPVHCEAFISASFASNWLATVSPRLELAMVAGIPQIGVAGVPWVRLEMETGAEGHSIRLRPRALYLLDRRMSLRSPAFHLALPELPAGSMLTSVSPRRAASSSGGCSASGGGRCRGMTSSGCWPGCARDRTASTSNGCA